MSLGDMAQRKWVLDEAKAIITKDRNDTHGEAEDSFRCIANFWTVYLGYSIQPHQVAMMLALVKVARQSGNAAHIDNYVDLAGYAALAAELATD